MKLIHDRYQKRSALQLNRAVLCAGVATIIFGISAHASSGAEPFQILESDLAATKPADTSVPARTRARGAAPQPFAMLASDVADGRTVIYQGSESAGDAQITNNSNELLYFNDNSTAAAAGIINNTGGATHFNDNTTAASAYITNNADAVLSFNQNSTAADARLVNNTDGNLVFNNNASAGSAVITNNGNAAFHGSASADNALITNNATGTIRFNNQSDAGYRNIYNNGQISFADQSSAKNSLIDNNQTGSIHFSADSTGAGANINNSGKLEFSDNSTAAQTAIVNNKTGTITFSGQADGAGTTLTNSGSVNFTQNSQAGSANLINNADADLRFNGQASAGSSMIVNAGDLSFSDKSSAAQSTIMTSEGGVTRFEGHADGGTATVQIDQNAQFDASRMDTGKLGLGALSSAGTVNLGSTVLTLQGNAVLNQSSTLNLILGYGQLIAQDVELQGGKLEIQRAADLLYALGKTYKIIDAQSFAGSNFAPDIAHDFAFVTPLLSEDGTGITLDRNTVRFESVAQTQNQTAVANAIEGLEPDRLIYRALISGSKTDALHNFNQLSGEIHASVESTVHDNSSLLRMALLQRARLSGGGDDQLWRSWLSVTGSRGDYKGDASGNIASARLSGYGLTGGVERTITDEITAGFAGNYEQNTLKIADRASTADIKTFGGGVYAGWHYEGFGLRSGAAYQQHAIDTDRSINLPSLTGSVQSDYKAWTGQVFAEAGYRLNAAGFEIEPFAGVSYVNSHFNAFQEYGVMDAALSGANATLRNTIGTLGVRMNKRFMLSNGFSVDAQFEAAWNRAFGDQQVARQVAFSSALPFEISGTGLSRDYLMLDARLSLLRSERFDVNVIYSGLLSKEIKNHRFGTSATLRF